MERLGLNRAAPWLALAALAGGAGCEALYDDLRTAEQRAADRELFGDGDDDVGDADVGDVDGGPGLLRDAGPGDDPDGGAPGVEDADPPGDGPEVLSTGTWEGRTGYRASGGARIVREPDGRLFLEMAEDFVSQGVPGPVVVVSDRDRLGTSIRPDEGDIELAQLTRTTGFQRYELPPEAADAAFSWVYCRPFGVEVARAPMEPAR